MKKLISLWTMVFVLGFTAGSWAQTDDSQLADLIAKGRPLSADQAAALEKLQLQSAQKINRRVILFHPPLLKPRSRILVKKKRAFTAAQLQLSQTKSLRHLNQLAGGNIQQFQGTLSGLRNWANTYNGVDFHKGGLGRPLSITGPVTILHLPCYGVMGAPASNYAPATPNESTPMLLSNGYADDGAISNPMVIQGDVATQPGWFNFMAGPYNIPPGTPSLQPYLNQIGVTINGAYALASTTGIFQTLCLFEDSGKPNETIQGSCVDYGGNHGHYEMKVQVLKMNAQGIPQYKPNGDLDFEDAGPVETADLFGPGSNMAGAASSGGLAMTFLSASATFTQIANVVRVAVRCDLGDTRVSAQSIDQTPAEINSNGQITDPSYYTYYPTPFYDPTSSNAFNPAWNYETPFEVDIIPTEMLQVKYMPLAIVYAPPGDGSHATYQISNTYTSKFTVQDSWAQSYTNSNLNVSTFALNLGLNFLVYQLNAGYSNEWDDTTTAVNGATTVRSNAWSLSTVNSIQIPAQMSGLPPDDSEPYTKQPFWADQFILIPHAQFAVWNYQPSQAVGDGPALNIMQLIGVPTAYFPASVGQLVDCALDGFCGTVSSFNQLLTGAGYSPLSSLEASNLLSLDPFYTAQWQGWPGAAGTNPPVAGTNTGGRGALLVSTAFGAQPSSSGTANNQSQDLTVIQNTATQTTDSTLSQAMTYNSSVETDWKQTTTSGGTVSFNPIQEDPVTVTATGGLSFSSSSTVKKVSELDFNQLASNEKTVANTVQVTGNLANSGSEIAVNVYEDLLYGGMMFQDVHEPPPPPTPVP
jgi:hypothetical protein